MKALRPRGSIALNRLSRLTLHGRGGFLIRDEAQRDQNGYSVSAAGDVNGDGLEDVVIGAPQADPNGLDYAGRAYVVFGKTGTEPVNVSDVANGIGGFVMDGGIEGELAGTSVAGAGDVNGDGLADVMVYSDRNCCTNRVGAVYVVFGKADTSPVVLDPAWCSASSTPRPCPSRASKRASAASSSNPITGTSASASPARVM